MTDESAYLRPGRMHATRLLISDGRVKAYFKDGTILVLGASGSTFLTISPAGKTIRQLSSFALTSDSTAQRLCQVCHVVILTPHRADGENHFSSIPCSATDLMHWQLRHFGQHACIIGSMYSCRDE